LITAACESGEWWVKGSERRDEMKIFEALDGFEENKS
jgi:hypothetical protein